MLTYAHLTRYMIPGYMKKNFENFLPVVAKDMAHNRFPAAGCMGSYAVMDTFKHVHLPAISSVIDTENFRSWNTLDMFVRLHFPEMDDKSVAIIGDGQKGELKSHQTAFSKALLRACYRHRRADLIRDRTVGKVHTNDPCEVTGVVCAHNMACMPVHLPDCGHQR